MHLLCLLENFIFSNFKEESKLYDLVNQIHLLRWHLQSRKLKENLGQCQESSLHHETQELGIQASAASTQLISLRLQLWRGLKGKSMMGKRMDSIFSETFGCCIGPLDDGVKGSMSCAEEGQSSPAGEGCSPEPVLPAPLTESEGLEANQKTLHGESSPSVVIWGSRIWHHDKGIPEKTQAIQGHWTTVSNTWCGPDPGFPYSWSGEQKTTREVEEGRHKPQNVGDF
ncbi:uncharacterized protein LOC111183605 [Delphinapterus leucas]|uniref:Uncharacterized protein LOC111183605 n=1 Tax=Delphinapterus leucas TaxID=9749 RepID=A0A2Y9PIK9_DELLE|nr:uncharacterized protein LOC111183605 [Delphinapterus leucas]